mgnify:CR=1 FL=1
MKERLEYAVKTILSVIVQILGVALLITVAIQIAVRYLPVTVAWTDELSRFLFVWYAMLSIAVSYIEDKHLFLDILYSRLKPGMQHMLDGISHILVLATAVLITWKGMELLQIVRIQKAPILTISMAWFYAAVPVGFLFVAFHALFSTIDFFGKKGREARKALDERKGEV